MAKIAESVAVCDPRYCYFAAVPVAENAMHFVQRLEADVSGWAHAQVLIATHA